MPAPGVVVAITVMTSPALKAMADDSHGGEKSVEDRLVYEVASP